MSDVPHSSKPIRETTSTRRSRKKRRLQIQVGPEDAQRIKPTLRERIRLDARVGFPGLAISLLFHAVLLGIMALIAVRVFSAGEDDVLLLSWLTTTSETTQEAPSTVTLDSFEVPVKRPEPKQPDTEPDQNPTVTGSTDVKPVDVTNTLTGREKDRRDTLLLSAGGDEKTQEAVRAGLFWLKRQQGPDGNWKLHEGYPDPGEYVLRTDTGATALSLLCLIGAGNSHMQGDHAQAVRKGIKWLMNNQKENGDYHDHIELGRQTAFYAHSQATIAICEAYALTGDTQLRDSAETAVRFLLESQHPTLGGWRYQPQNEQSLGDLSVTGWALMALHTARMAGIDFSREAFERGAKFLDAVQSQGGAVYRYQPGAPVSAAMTASGLLSRQYLGWPQHHPAMQEGLLYLKKPQFEPRWEAGVRNVYEWYYIGNVLHNFAGDEWKSWYPRVQKMIVAEQMQVGGAKLDIRGSWNPLTPQGSPHEYAQNAGRLYFTAMCLLILETPYRHLPIYQDSGE